MSENQRPEDCTHPDRGGQEDILRAGTGDHHCRSCGEAMPIIMQPGRCLKCGSQSGRMALIRRTGAAAPANQP
jgi:hypothetical protein